MSKNTTNATITIKAKRIRNIPLNRHGSLLGTELHVEIAKNLDYKMLYMPLPGMFRGLVKESFVFAILTVNEKTSRAESAMLRWRTNGMPTDTISLTAILKSLQYWPTKMKNIIAILNRIESEWDTFNPDNYDSADDYRNACLKANVAGLGWIKTTFACYLAYGGGNIACIDRHMFRLWTGNEQLTDKDWQRVVRPSKRTGYPIQLKPVEDSIVQVAALYGWSASALQWAIWCESMGTFTDHSVAYRFI